MPVPKFNGVGLRGGGDIVVKYGKEQKVTLLRGSTQYTTFKVEPGGGLEIRACNADCPTHYDLEIEIVTPDLNAVAISGGGTIHAAGTFPATESISAAVNGGGDIDIHAISAKSVNAAVSGGGEVIVTATTSLRAAVNGGGSVAYHGNPSISSAVSGGGSVSRAD
ncbi:MAG: DUF2807 domain-containing protein [Proteobacteria bacterium]|nr:DUF2807 domain-containing protein [Pseudomonadota bacterium]